MPNFNCNDLIKKMRLSNSASCRTIENYCRNINTNALKMDQCREKGLECVANKQCSENNEKAPCKQILSESQINHSGIQCNHWVQGPKKKNAETGKWENPERQCILTIDKDFFRQNPQPACSQGHQWKFKN